MLTLRAVLASPFARKTVLAAHHLGLADRIKVVAADTADPNDDLRQQNPLGKIPTLILEDGTAFYDSRVILEYLDEMAGGAKLFPKGKARLDVLRRQALGDGIMDASVLQIYEARWRPEEKREQKWLDHQAGKVKRALDTIEADPPPLHDPIDAGDISLACALGYLDFRFGGTWRKSYPKLVAWLTRFEKTVPAFDKTRPPPPQ
jgi:glutathione S-transferase